MIREHSSTLKWWSDLDTKWPLIYYTKGNMFSVEGASLSTFCVEHNLPEITIELGQVGLDLNIFDQLVKLTFEMLNQPTSYWRTEIHQIQDLTHTLLADNQKSTTLLIESEVILKQSPHHILTPGWKNLTHLPARTLYAKDGNQEFYTNDECYILFPKYGEYQKTTQELCRFLKPY